MAKDVVGRMPDLKNGVGNGLGRQIEDVVVLFLRNRNKCDGIIHRGIDLLLPIIPTAGRCALQSPATVRLRSVKFSCSCFTGLGWGCTYDPVV